MKWLKFLLVVLVLAAGSGSALAHGRGHFGVYIDVPLWQLYYPGPYYPAYPQYYPPAVVVQPAQPTVYVEQPVASPAAPAPAASYWYHCSKPNGYYPYVKDCPGGWQKVVPQPPGQ